MLCHGCGQGCRLKCSQGSVFLQCPGRLVSCQGQMHRAVHQPQALEPLCGSCRGEVEWLVLLVALGIAFIREERQRLTIMAAT